MKAAVIPAVGAAITKRKQTRRTHANQPKIPVTELEHSAFCKPGDELPGKTLMEEKAVNVQW